MSALNTTTLPPPDQWRFILALSLFALRGAGLPLRLRLARQLPGGFIFALKGLEERRHSDHEGGLQLSQFGVTLLGALFVVAVGTHQQFYRLGKGFVPLGEAV